MAVVTLIRSLKLKDIGALSRLFLANPEMFWPTVSATIRSIEICDRLFPGLHAQNNSTNAFRHALWNILLVKKVHEKKNDLQQGLIWARKVTDWHEILYPNNDLERSMDLHNNAAGRKYYCQLQPHGSLPDEDAIINMLQQKRLKSIKVSSVEQIREAEDNLVHLKDLENEN